MDASQIIARQWFRHPVVVTQPGTKNALGETKPGQKFQELAAVDAKAQKVTDQNGQEVTASAVVQWRADGPLPAVGWTVTLPAEFGLKPGRSVVTAQLVSSGTGMTPDYVEVTLK